MLCSGQVSGWGEITGVFIVGSLSPLFTVPSTSVGFFPGLDKIGCFQNVQFAYTWAPLHTTEGLGWKESWLHLSTIVECDISSDSIFFCFLSYHRHYCDL
jgi:hypothetical protein